MEVSRGIIPIADDETGMTTQDDAEIGIGVEKPAARAIAIGDGGLTRAKAGLEVLGAGFERQDSGAQDQPPTSADESGAAQKGRGNHPVTGPSRSRMTRLRSVSSRICLRSEAPSRSARPSIGGQAQVAGSMGHSPGMIVDSADEAVAEDEAVAASHTAVVLDVPNGLLQVEGRELVARQSRRLNSMRR